MTYQPKSDFLHVMQARGYMQDCTDLQGLDEALLKEKVPGYIGFDATAPSLHVGSLMQIMMLRWLQKTGHRPIVLMGGGTSKIGDPSFRSEERKMMTDEVIRQNIEGIRQVFDRYVDFGAGALMVDNAEWLDGLQYIPFLREVGRFFSVNRMLTFESVRSRLDREQSLSFLEFNYMILQAYDFMELNRRHGCLLQMGGSDQWGNIVNGIDLTRRMNGVEVFGLTSPLLTKADGTKMGKTAEGAVWLNADMLSPYYFWQFWRNTADADVGRFLRLYTELPLDEIARLEALEGAEINEAKIILAREVTALCHGREAAEAAEATARGLFSGSQLPPVTQPGDFERSSGGVQTLSPFSQRGDFEHPSGGAQTLSPFGQRGTLPTLTLSSSDFGEHGISVAQLFVRSGLAGSGKEARRLIADGGARLDDQPVTEAGLMLTRDRFAKPVKLSAGRKRHALARLG